MKYWLSHLPLEVWVDVFCYPWRSREEIGQIVDRFGNRKYGEYLQFYLHDWGKRKLTDLHFDEKGIYKHVHPRQFRRFLDIPQTPMPGNIKSFDCITIGHFDAQTFGFLRLIAPILTNVNLHIWHINRGRERESTRIVLANLLPMLDGIHSLWFFVQSSATVQQCFVGDQLARIKVLRFEPHFDETIPHWRPIPVNFILNWLTLPEHNNGPKLCKLRAWRSNESELVAAIRQQFLAATAPSTFAVIIHKQQFAEFHFENKIGEELHGQVFETTGFQIIRHKASRGTELAEWIKENQSNDGRQIKITRPTIGEIDASMDVPED